MVHWREEASGRVLWQCKTIEEAVLSKAETVVRIRRFIDCIFSWAIETRLPAIKSVLQAASKLPSTVAGSTASLTTGTPSQDLTLGLLTPTSALGRKRSFKEANIADGRDC